MTTEEIKTKLNYIFQEVFEDKNIIVTESMVASDVDNWDSITNVMMIEKVEKEFKVRFKLKEIIALQNVGELIESIQKHLSAR